MNPQYWPSLAGATIAWIIAFGTTLAISILAKAGKFQVAEETKNRLDLLASLSLSFIAINIISPFPLLDEKPSALIQVQNIPQG